MGKAVTLKDGTEVLIRELRSDDVDRSHAFFLGLPEEDQTYLRVDVANRDIVAERIRAMETGSVKRLVAVAGDRIVADGALELAGPGWKEHMGELRVIVARPYQRKGLGMLMVRMLYAIAASAGLDEIVAKVMGPQQPAQSILRRLGFREEGVLPAFVKDLHGERRDLVVMRCDLKAMWQELEEYFDASDWQRTR